MLAKLCRLAIGASIVFGYPLTFVGIRDGVLNLAGVKKVGGFESECTTRQRPRPRTSTLTHVHPSTPQQPSERTQTLTTLALLAIVSTLAVFLRDVGFVVSFGGALLGSAIIYIFPAIIFIKTMAQKIKSGEIQETAAVRNEVALNKGIAGIGVLMAIIGASVSVLKTFVLNK